MTQKYLIAVITGAISLLFIPRIVYANVENIDFLGQNSRWSIDASTRLTRNIEQNNNAFSHVLGLDIHKVFSRAQHDIGTLTFQPYLVKLNNVSNPPFIFNDGNDTQLTWRIANFNYTALAQGKFNIRLGHFEVPFGLEQHIDTNGTLRQLTSKSRGIKADWGASINGILPQLDYEIALTRGSGNDIRSANNPYIFSGRIGTPTHKNLIAGASWFIGDVLGKNDVTQHKKVGLDITYYYYQWQFMAETSMGQTENNNTTNTFIEALWKSARESVSTYVQAGYRSMEINDNKTNSASYWLVGAQWVNQYGIDVSAQYKHHVKNTLNLDIDPTLSVQIRYRM